MKRVKKQYGVQDGNIQRNIWEIMLDFLYPRRCVVCDEVADDENAGVCHSCASQITYIKPPFCMKCGKQLNVEEEYCRDCRNKKHMYIQGTALFEYGSVADALFRFKYAGRAEYAKFFAKELWQRRGAWLYSLKPDALVPVPIHSSRKRKRGYNQAMLIAKELSRFTGIPVNTKLIVRTKRTLPQKGLTEKQRQNNLKKAFKILKNDVKLNTIVIVDDIYTTGSTVDAMSELLLQTGIKKIYYMALAVGRG